VRTLGSAQGLTKNTPPIVPVLGCLLIAMLWANACQPAPNRAVGTQDERKTPNAGRTLVIIAGGELATFAGKAVLLSGTAVDTRSNNARYVLNATLSDLDGQGLPNPFLAEALPVLNTGTWQVFPDGRMETLYRLRPNLIWHDRQPLTADDFVFAWHVYASREFGISTIGAMGSIEEVLGPDPRSVVIRWQQTYQAAGGLGAGSADDDLSPLPRHILEVPYRELDAEPFLSLPFWRDEYVGVGPWRLERREPGAFFEATAFDGFVFGRPKIDRVKVTYMPDPNTAVANLVSGDAHYSIEGLLFGEEGLTLERGWGAGGGKVIWEANQGRTLDIQSRPEYAVPKELATDSRVRQALAYAIDKEAMNEAITAGHGLLRDIYSHPNADYYETVLRGVAIRYRYDPRRAQELLEQAGFTRGGDGFWLTPGGDRFTLEQWYIAGATNERESTILVDTLRRFGIDAVSQLWGVQRTSNEERAKTSGIFGGQMNMPEYRSRDIPRPETRWTGRNRLGFSNAEFDRLWEGYDSTLAREERVPYIAGMERIASEQLPGIVLYWIPKVVPHAAALKGVVQALTPEGQNGARKIWTWEWAA